MKSRVTEMGLPLLSRVGLSSGSEGGVDESERDLNLILTISFLRAGASSSSEAD